MIPPVRPMWEFPAIRHNLAKEIVTLVKPVTPRGRILDIYNRKHTCTHVMWHPLAFGGVPMLRSTSPAKP